MKSKRVKLLIMCLMVLLVFTACSSNKNKENTESQTEETQEQEEEKQTAEWVQAYKDFLNNSENIQKFINGEYGGEYEMSEYTSNDKEFSGYCLYDFNNDNTPELMLCDEYSGKINLFTYNESDEQVRYVTSLYRSEPYNMLEPSRLYGYNIETGETIFYEEKFNDESTGEGGMCFSFYSLSLNDKALTDTVKIEDAYTTTLLWEDRTFYIEDGWIAGHGSNSYREELWEKFVLPDSEGKELTEKFTPFVWHTLDEIETYISNDYKAIDTKLQGYEVATLFKQIYPEYEEPKTEGQLNFGEYEEIYNAATSIQSIDDEFEVEDTLGIANEFKHKAVVYAINYTADCNNYSKTDFVIRENEIFNEEAGVYVSIVSFEYDYWVIMYIPSGERAVIFNDTTGSISENYVMPEEEVEWFD